MTNFLITKVLSSYSKGDFAVAKGMLDTITHHYPTAKISILCRDVPLDKKFFSKYGDVYSELFVMYGRKLPKPLLAIEFFFKILLYLIWIRFKYIPIDQNAKTIFSLYEKSDLILYCGGGSPGGYGLAFFQEFQGFDAREFLALLIVGCDRECGEDRFKILNVEVTPSSSLIRTFIGIMT